MRIPAEGKVIKEPGYNDQVHGEEIRVAGIIVDYYGLDIVLLNEVNEDHCKTADYMWMGKLWELKQASSVKALDDAVRRGLKQIKGNPGGIILDFGKHKINMTSAMKAISGRMTRGLNKTTDVLIIQNGQIVSVLRYKRK